MSLECMYDDDTLAFEIFYSDKDKTFSIETFSGPINVNEINVAMLIAEKRLPSKYDLSNNSINKLIASIELAASKIDNKTENLKTKDFLLAMAAWLNDSDVYYKNLKLDRDIGITDVFMDAIHAGLVYE